MRARTTTRVLSLMAVGVLALAACGGDDDDAPSQEDLEDAVDAGDGDDATDEGDEGDDDDAEAGDDEGDDEGDSDACAVLTQEDAEALFGVPAQMDDDAVDVGLGSSCVWENVGGDEIGTPSQLVQLQLYEGDQFYSEDVYPDAEKIPDLGDRAFIVGGEGTLGGPTIGFQVGNTVGLLGYSVVNIGVEEADQIDVEAKQDDFLELAHTVVDRV